MENELGREIEKILDKAYSKEVALKFQQKLQEGKFTRDEDPKIHFCTYFAAYDRENKQIFIGHHIKAGLWLFNGGHISQGETLRETVKREIDEEWGLDIGDLAVGLPALLTIAEIDNPTKQTCRLHLDIWHFINVEKDKFKPDPLKLAKEFYSCEWMGLEKAKEVVKNEGTLQAIDFIESNLF